MKRFSAVFLVSVSMMCSVFAQKVEIAASYKFGEPFGYWTEWDPNEGGMPFFNISMVDKQNIFYAHSPVTGYTYHLTTDGTYEFGEKDKNFILTRTQPINWQYGNHQISGFQTTTDGVIWKYTVYLSEHNGPVEFESKVHCDNLYYTGNILFVENQLHEFECIEFLSDGSYKIRNASDTDAWLKSGKGEELGWSQRVNSKGKVTENFFGDVSLNYVNTSYRVSVQSNLQVVNPKYEGAKSVKETGYSSFGKDGKGLLYYKKTITDDNGVKTVNFAILDPFTQKLYVYEDYAPNEWNPPRDANGKIIGSYSWTVAPDGNIYFTDADVEKGEYQIKRVINRWWDDMGIKDRIIGQMNTNHIPLLTTMNGSQNDGYCFENDFVWVTEQSKDKKWSKIKKIDGREGWIETKYIDINTMIPVTNASLGITMDQSPAAKILKAADNLRLRKTELTSSEVITTMLKGTQVKIVATGRQETIDGITGNWVQVEVQSGGKDRHGNLIPAGTTGWCFGGYLE